jgi:hypothetical protein
MKTNQFPRFILVALLAVVFSACAAQQSGPAKAELPVDKAYAEGKEIYFTHTEASNADVAKKLTDMMDSPVPYVPSLASVPDESLANVYSFSNGVSGSTGPQLPVFDSPPGSEGYSPLRRMNVVTWVDESSVRELKSAAEILEAAEAGELAIKQPGIVINMPFVVWDGGKR